MATFDGFPEGQALQIPIPAPFFNELLPQIDHLGELKLVLYVLQRLAHMEGNFRYLRRGDFAADERLQEALHSACSGLDEALQRALGRGVLLEAHLSTEQGEESYYFLNSPRGRAAIQAIESGRWRQTGDPRAPVEVLQAPPNIFRLYEENIGPLTPMIAEALGEAEDTYPAEWIQDAIRIAVEKNKRSWRYAEAILKRWHREGRDVRRQEQENQRDSAEARRRYVEGEFSDFIEH